MLAALLLALYLHFSGGNDMVGALMTQHVKEQVKKTIPDEDRRKLALNGLSIVNDDIKELNKQVSKDLGQMEKLIKDYDSKPEDFDRLFSSTLTKRYALIDKIWDDRTAMLQHVRADEWQAIISGARAAAEREAAKK
jgi:hypothetical protein